jgi:ADP-heptose:LPS heptosyltransferase
VVRAGLSCSPCFKRNCADNVRCMEEITVDEVMRKIAL